MSVSTTLADSTLPYREAVLQPSAVAIPHHKLSESPNSRSIDIFDWFITTSTNPISNAADCDALQATLGFPLPEMTFGSNLLTLEHRPSGWKYTFATDAALKAVKNGELQEGDGGVKVGYADKWLESRIGPSSSVPMPKTVPTKPYDWTYTTTYMGHEHSGAVSEGRSVTWATADHAIPSHAIPMAELTRPDPILFYAEIPLFEDELHDNGSSSLIVRIQLPRRDDLTPLTDPTFIAKVLTDLPVEVSQKEGANTRWRGLARNVEIATLA
ncbi:hypothetical protein H0H81_005855 [Sphagnurus paluster]|uniref:Uncharacterized protein n=1 Tax=Sphagnurus paluster TaxID=117069 RepID=A0A9P7G340_9AGAR|nr:hypothetical protein H0H81_005855 [Sphagnurus paluster]